MLVACLIARIILVSGFIPEYTPNCELIQPVLRQYEIAIIHVWGLISKYIVTVCHKHITRR